MKVLIAGATGAMGSLLLEELCNDERFNSIFVVTRKDITNHSSKIKEIKVKSLSDLSDLNPNKVGSILNNNINNLENMDVLFCCVGTTIKTAGSKEAFRKVDYEGVKILADLAERFKIKHFILISAAGANKNSTVFYNKIKGEAEEELLRHSIPQISIFRPGLLLTDRMEFRLGELLAIKAVRFLNIFLPKQLTSVFATDSHSLVQCMKEHSLLNQHEKKIIEAKDIK